ncbi:3-demethylubiquinone-9 3-methyltransferase [Isoptericola jiangsuensis]|uniref:3-demethylubiquinone-9 3-methyltransferase n=1 Tax=Isoptericola jiangsuensis TaxID=548579 RepID=A0A2A9EYS7_9MICO|nr:class I SAM-dependent methyltransferase [Isoptericola jiangsuensis]PFG44214.1 3-demethylubiquinone-9 3-methyltransferase [Isoptericola jiangsuensis]
MEPVSDDEVAYWDRWNATHRRPEALDQVSLDQSRAVHAAIGRLARTDLRVLDIGCGTGWLVDELLRYGSVTGIDVSRDVIAEARRRTPRATFLSGDVLAGELPSGAFDCIVSLETLPHVSDQGAFMRELRRLVVPGGLIVLAVQNGAVLGKHGRVPDQDPRVRRRWPTPESLRELAGQAGTVVSLRTITPQGDASWRRVFTSKKLRDALGPVGLRWHAHLERIGWGRTLVVEIRADA